MGACLALAEPKQASVAEAKGATGRDGGEVRQLMEQNAQSRGVEDFSCNFGRDMTVFGDRGDLT